MNKEFYFSVTDVLEDLKLAKNYNNFLADLVIKHCPNKNGLTLDFGAGKGFITNLVVMYIPKTYAIGLSKKIHPLTFFLQTIFVEFYLDIVLNISSTFEDS